MAIKSTKQLLSELAGEADEARSEMGSAKSNLVRAGEKNSSITDEDEEEDDFEDEEEEQDEDSEEEEEDELEEESDEGDEEEEEEDEDSEDDESDEEDEDAEDEDEEELSDNEKAAQRRILNKKDKKIEELTNVIESLKKANSKAEQEDILAEISPLAEELKLDPEGLSKIIEASVRIAEKRLSAKLPSDEEVARQRESNEKKADEEYFSTEWKQFQPKLLKQYPDASARQLEEAKVLMDKIAHDPKRGGRKYEGKDGRERLMGHPLNFLAFEYKRDFDSILSKKKRHGLESSGVADSFEMEDAPDVSTSKGADKLDKMYRDVESSSSGLRRGRRPRSRSI